MSTEITTTKTFQERMFERVRDQMGDLLTDDDLKKIVNSAVQKAFFEERVVRSGYSDVKEPAIFVKMMEHELRDRVSKATEQWLKDNPEIVTQTIERVIQDGIFKAVMQTLEWRMNWPLQQFAEQLKSKGVFS
jgi:lantibiotic modifying enzyme